MTQNYDDRRLSRHSAVAYVPSDHGRPAGEPGAHDAAGEILRGRRESSVRLAEGLDSLVRAREKLRDDVLYAIDRDEMVVGNLIAAMYRPAVTPTDNPAYVKLRVEQLRLARERRQSVVECWRDTVLLSKDLEELVERTREVDRLETLIRGGRP